MKLEHLLFDATVPYLDEVCKASPAFEYNSHFGVTEKTKFTIVDFWELHDKTKVTFAIRASYYFKEDNGKRRKQTATFYPFELMSIE